MVSCSQDGKLLFWDVDYPDPTGQPSVGVCVRILLKLPLFGWFWGKPKETNNKKVIKKKKKTRALASGFLDGRSELSEREAQLDFGARPRGSKHLARCLDLRG